MNKKIAILWLSAIMLFSFVVIIVEIASVVKAPTIIYVDDVPGEGPGNPAENYTNIQDAINAANEGETIFVYNGTYNENILVNKMINLTGEDQNSTIINGGGGGSVLKVTVDWVNITRLNITNGNVGVRINNSNWCKINHNNIFLNKNYGILLFYSMKNEISENLMIENGIHIRGDDVHHWNTHDIYSSNTVNGKQIYYKKDQVGGIIPQNMGQVILANCSNIPIENQDYTNVSVGIEVGFSTHINIMGNIISNNTIGIFLSHSNNNSIYDNHVNKNNGPGLNLRYSNNNNITNNNVTDNDRQGIYLINSDGTNFVGNNVLSNYNEGILLETSSNNNILGNNVLSNGIFTFGPGIEATDQAYDNIIMNNNISSNSVGIYLHLSPYQNIKGNNISNNINWGIYFYQSSYVTIINNKILHNGMGISDERSSFVTISNNVISWNVYGMRIDLCSYISIIGNNVSSNDDNGILIVGMDNNARTIVSLNYVYGGKYGITTAQVNNVTITSNSIISTSIIGVVLSMSKECKVYHNNIINNAQQADDDNGNENFWNASYPSGGNYWSDFDESGDGAYDDFQGADQDLLGSDGIVDNGTVGGGGKNPYLIDSDSQDNYPLIEPYYNYIILKQGWNLISLPLIQKDRNLIKVLDSIDGPYDAAQWYNTTDKIDPWKHYKVGKPFGNDLFDINEKMGFWIHITQPGDTIFRYNGTQPTVNQTITLYPGWNMVGYPSLTNYNRTKGLNNLTFGTHVDSIWTYDAATQRWNEIGPSDYFEIGRGYWVHAKTQCEWEVPL